MKTSLWNKPLSLKPIKKRLSRLKTLCAGDIMAVSVRCISHEATVNEAYEEMRRYNLASLIVSENSKFLGIITQQDLNRALQLNLGSSRAALYLPERPCVVQTDTSIFALRDIMVNNALSMLPVIDKKGRAVGVVSEGALLRAMPNSLGAKAGFEGHISAVKPNTAKIEALFKRIFPISVYYLLNKIGKLADKAQVKAYAVGGFVRDLLLERANTDIDIVVIGDAMPFVTELAKELGCKFKLFNAFRTGRLYIDNLKIDFSSARIEHYKSIGALPEIALSGLCDDLHRRDFTINALALDLSPGSFLTLIDEALFYQDLVKKQLRIMHPYSFYEDPTRLFRAIRFMVRFGFLMHPDTLKAFNLAIRHNAPSRLSTVRIGAEISRCLNEEHPYKTVKMLFEAGLMRFLCAELTNASGLPKKFRLVKPFVKRFSPLQEEIDSEGILWAGLLGTLKQTNTFELLNQIGLLHSRQRLVKIILGTLKEIPLELDKIEITNSKKLYSLLHGLPLEALIALMAFELNKRNARKVLRFITDLRSISCEINGRDLIKAGFKPGPDIRKVFSYIISLKLEGKQLTKQQELQIAIRQSKYL